MNIRSMHIKGFGRFTNETFHVDPNNQLIYGKNETGKSTLYHFIRTMLFGFPSKREMVRDFTPVNGAVYGGVLVLEHPMHGQISIERYKETNRGQAKVVMPGGEVGDDVLLERLIHPLTKEVFDHIFTFQQEQLTDLSQLNEVRLQHLLLSVGLTGSERLTDLTDSLLKRRQKIYKPMGRIPVLNQKLQQLDKLERKIVESEQQEASYQGKLARQQELLKMLDELTDDKKHLQDLEKTLLEQQKRFPLYVEWQSLQKEVGRLQKVSSSVVNTIKDSLQEYRYLEKREKDILTSQVGENKSDAPGFQFYLANQSLFDDVLTEQLVVEKMVERRRVLEEQLKDYQESKKVLLEKYQLENIQLGRTVSEFDRESMNQLASKEEELVREKVLLTNEKSRLSIQRRELDTDLTLKEQELNQNDITQPIDSKQKETPTGIGMLSSVGIGLGAIFIVLAFVLGQYWLMIPGMLLLLIGGGARWWSQQEPAVQQETEQDKEAYVLQLTLSDEVEGEYHALIEKLETVTDSLQRIMDQKQEWSDLYGLSMKDTLQTWLMKMPVFEQLGTIQEKETEMAQNLATIDAVLVSYSESLHFASQWIPFENQTISEKFEGVRQFVEAQQAGLKEQMYQDSDLLQTHNQLEDIKMQKEGLIAKMTTILGSEYGSRVEDISIWLKEQEQWQSSQQRLSEVTLAVEDYFDLTKDYQLLQINQTLLKTKDQQDSVQQRVEELQAEYQTVKFESQQMEKNGTLAKLYQERENELTYIQALSDEWLGYRLAEEMTQDVLQFLSDQQLPALLTTVSSYFKLLTKDRYHKVYLKEGRLMVRDITHQWPVVQLSTGTKDQLFMAFRLGFIHLHLEDYQCPVMIDDGWLNLDQDRKTTLFNLLKGLSQKTQIITLSSDTLLHSFYQENELPVIELERR